VLNSLRFGPLKFSAMDLRQLSSLKVPPRSETGPAAGSFGPLCLLIGDNVLAATIDAPQLKLVTPGGIIGLPVKDIHAAERLGDPKAAGTFSVELDNGRKVSGTLVDHAISVRFHDKVWEVPGPHLVGITGPRKAEPAPPTPAIHREAPKQPVHVKRPTSKPATPGADDDPFGPDPVIGPEGTAPAVPAPPAIAPAQGEDPFGP
jgi:hypothetical protein